MRQLFSSALLKVLLVISLIASSTASLAFVVKAIRVEGLQNLNLKTVESYLPVKVGQDFDDAKSDRALKALFKTGFFDQVNLYRQQDTLVVAVKERPMITAIRIDGNKEISLDKIQPVMKKIGLVAGQIYDPMKLRLFDKSLEQQYAMMGFNATSVSSSANTDNHNRVSVKIKVDEGDVVKVNGIHITGNHAFSERKLRNQFTLTTPGVFTWFSHKDRFSQTQLDKDLQNLSKFYMNHGYLRFKIVSTQVVPTPNHKRVDIYVTVEEGPVYDFTGFDVSGQTLHKEAELRPLIPIKAGDTFSRALVIRSEKIIRNFYADKAYAFVQVSVNPAVDDAQHQVFIHFDVQAGKRVYVRRIDFTGNQVTDQEVLRREMRQMEAAPYSLSKIEESKRRLMLTNYFGDVHVKKKPVAGLNNQMDLQVDVKEKASGKATLQGGYSTAYGFLYGASVTQPNFLGTGKYVALGFNNSQVFQTYTLSYVNPYYTWYGVSRGFNVFFNRNNYNQSFNFAPYVMDSYGGDVNFGFPLSENNMLSLDMGYARDDISHINNQGTVAPSIIQFLGAENDPSTNVQRSYNVTKAVSSWTYTGLDRAFMPTKGVQNNVGLEFGVPIFTQNVAYYILSDKFKAYLPVGYGFILNFVASLGYGQSYDGTSVYPFFNNFYAGGIGTVPGYQVNSLGPKYNYCPASVQSTIPCYPGSAIGGNLLTTGGVHFILPNLFSDQVRVAFTLDAGNIFQSPVNGKDKNALYPGTNVPLLVQEESFSLDNMRTAAGILVLWNAPMIGPIDLSLAFPLNKKPYDQTQNFQFAMGISF
jgi:outer membrane protein insertion porin family